MAGNWKSTREIGNLGKRVVKLSHIFNPHPPTPTPTPRPRSRRTAHTSAYDKNVDDQVGPSVVPDEVIEPQSEKYWAPNPRTGVFGPATSTDAGGGERGCHSSPTNGPEDSVLEEKAWFRPTSLEDLEKPHHHEA